MGKVMETIRLTNDYDRELADAGTLDRSKIRAVEVEALVEEGAQIAKEQVYTRCGGSNASPALFWSGAPAGTKSFAVTAIDLSVKPNEWSHWIAVDIPQTVSSLGKGTALPQGAKPVMTDFGDARYDGPCPPPGSGA